MGAGCHELFSKQPFAELCGLLIWCGMAPFKRALKQSALV